MDDEIEDIESGSASAFLKRFFNTLKNLWKIVWNFFKTIFGFLVSNSWIILIIVFITAVIAAVSGVVAYFFSGGFDENKGTMQSLGGVKSDKFYGTRYVYYNEEYTTQHLADTYLEFTYNILLDVKSGDDSKINIDFTKPYKENTQINTIATSYAQTLLNKDAPNLSLTLTDCTAQINHYGFDETSEVDLVLDKLATDLTSGIKGGLAYTTLDKTQILNELKTSFNSNFAYMKNVCSKILIKDYILTEEEKSMDIPKNNYLGFVYMPKQDVTMKSTNFIFKIDNEQEVQIKANYKDGENITEIDAGTADSSWFKGGSMEKAMDLNLNSYNLKQFKSLDDNDINYFATEKSLFEICRENKQSIYFNDDVNFADSSTIMSGFKTDAYFYLELQGNSNYNMVDIMVSY